MYTLVRNKLWKDILIGVLVTILVGSVVVFGISYVADKFLYSTVSGLVGESDEYQILIQTKVEAAEDGIKALEEMSQFPGIEVKQSMNLLSRANLLVSLGDNPSGDEISSFLTAVTNIPGYTSATIIMEPRLMVSGIAEKTIQLIRPYIDVIDGIKYSFKFGKDLHIVCESPEKMEQVEKEVKSVLDRYFIADIRYTDGANRVDTVEDIEKAIEADSYGWRVYQITSDSSDEFLFSTLEETKRLFGIWKTKISIVSDLQGIGIGQEFVLLREEDVTSRQGSSLQEDDVLIATVSKEYGNYQCKIIQGETEDMIKEKLEAGISERDDSEMIEALTFPIIKVVNGVLGEVVGEAEVINPRVDVQKAVDKAGVIASEMIGSAQNALGSVQTSIDAVDAYEYVQDALVQLQRGLEDIGVTPDGFSASSDWNLNSDKIESVGNLLNTISNSLDKFKGVLKGISFFTGAYDTLVSDIGMWQERLASFYGKITEISAGIGDGGSLAGVFGDMISFSENIMRNMNSIDPEAIKESLTTMKSQIISLSSDGIDNLGEQLEVVKSSLPSLKDYEMSEALDSLENLVAQSESSDYEQASFLVKSDEPSVVAQAIKANSDGNVESVYVMQAGIVQTGVRGEVDRLLVTTKTMLSGVITLVFIVLALLFDHAQITAFLIVMNPGNKLSRFVYPAVIGAILSGTISYITNSGLGPVTGYQMAVVGALIGIIVAFMSRNFAHIDNDEIEACCAFGIKEIDIMREVVIPSGKIGIFKLINSARMRMGRKASLNRGDVVC